MEKECLLRDLNQAHASEVEADKKIADLEALVQKKIYLFKRVKSEQGCMDQVQGKPPRYHLEADVARGDRVESGSLVFDVPPSPGALESILRLLGILLLVQPSWLLL